jgi:hypothetical protein
MGLLMINENLQTLHISNPLSFFSLLFLLSFFSKSFFLFPALILLFVVPRHFCYNGFETYVLALQSLFALGMFIPLPL